MSTTLDSTTLGFIILGDRGTTRGFTVYKYDILTDVHLRVLNPNESIDDPSPSEITFYLLIFSPFAFVYFYNYFFKAFFSFTSISPCSNLSKQMGHLVGNYFL